MGFADSSAAGVMELSGRNTSLEASAYASAFEGNVEEGDPSRSKWSRHRFLLTIVASALWNVCTLQEKAGSKMYVVSRFMENIGKPSKLLFHDPSHPTPVTPRVALQTSSIPS